MKLYPNFELQLDETLENVIEIDEPTVEEKLKDMEIEEDAAFEFMEQFDTCKEWMQAGYRINFVKSTGGDVVTDKLQCAMPVVFDPPFMPGAEEKVLQKSQPKPEIKTPKVEKHDLYTFDEVMAKISQDGRTKLQSENLLLENVLARVTNQDIADLKLSDSDLVILRQIVLQCRYHEHTRGGADALTASIKAHSLYQKFPFKSDATFAALHSFGIKSANELYLYTSISRLHQLFSKMQIATADQQAIQAGIGLAQYARNIAKQNRRRMKFSK